MSDLKTTDEDDERAHSKADRRDQKLSLVAAGPPRTTSLREILWLLSRAGTWEEGSKRGTLIFTYEEL